MDLIDQIILVPKISVGSFFLGNSIKPYLNQYNFEYTERDADTDFDDYEISSLGLSCWVKSDIIVSISCEKSLLLNGEQIIGMHIGDFIKLIDSNPDGAIDKVDFEDDEEPQYVYEFDDLELQVWVRNMRIKTIIASKYYEDYDKL